MRTTLDLPDPLFRELKARSALRSVLLKDFVETAPVGWISGFVAKVPFAENTAGVADGLQQLRQRES